jgi:hypothetical protein
VAAQAAEKFSLPEGQEPTEEQLAQVEGERATAALMPFHNVALRETRAAPARKERASHLLKNSVSAYTPLEFPEEIAAFQGRTGLFQRAAKRLNPP